MKSQLNITNPESVAINKKYKLFQKFIHKIQFICKIIFKENVFGFLTVIPTTKNVWKLEVLWGGSPH